MQDQIMEQKNFYETDNFIVAAPLKLHIPREDGGHIWIRAKEKYFSDRTAFEHRCAIEVMRLTMLLGEAMQMGMKKRGEALYFPNPASSFYDDFEALNDEDIEVIKNEIYKLECTEKYDVSSWK